MTCHGVVSDETGTVRPGDTAAIGENYESTNNEQKIETNKPFAATTIKQQHTTHHTPQGVLLVTFCLSLPPPANHTTTTSTQHFFTPLSNDEYH